MDTILSEKGYRQFVFITPDQGHMEQTRPKNPLLKQSLQQHGLSVIYIQDLLEETTLSSEDFPSLFHDGLHLSKKGHVFWAQVLAKELQKHLIPLELLNEQ